MMVAIDETRQNDLIGQVQHLVGRRGQRIARPDSDDHAVLGKNAAIGDFSSLVVHGHEQRGISREQTWHCVSPEAWLLTRRRTLLRALRSNRNLRCFCRAM